jgi:hypothetical protein
MPQILEAAAIENGLRLDGQRPYVRLEWLEESYGDTESFWHALKKTSDARFAVPSVSSFFSRYGFYHDIIVRNLNNPAPALSWYELASGFRNVSYRELGAMADAKAGFWARLGVKPGQTLCIIRAMCPELIFEMLAALKMGCVLSFLPPQGKGFLQRRLDALQPDHIVIDAMHSSLLSSWSKRVLAEDTQRDAVYPQRERFFMYPSGQTVFRSFNPCGYEPHIPSDVACDAAYLCALRDGVIALGLGPGHVYAAPGFHCMETCPSLLLAGLLCGATYLHLSPKVIAARPELVIEQPIKAFGVSKKVRDILLETQIHADDSWECWFRNPAESQDMDQWHYFIQRLKLENAYAFNLRWDAAMGGCSLFSIRRKGMAHMNVMPAPGNAWCLGDLFGVGKESSTDIGTYSISAPGAPGAEMRGTADVIARNRQEWVFAGLNLFNKEGRTYPVQEILESLRNMGNRYSFFSSFVDVPQTDPGSGHRGVLLIFRGAKAGFDDAMLLSHIRSLITQDMGDEFQPDEIKIFPLYPRFLQDAEVDHQWCRSQYLTGSLFRRSREEIFQCTTRLRNCIMNMGAVGGKH